MKPVDGQIVGDSNELLNELEDLNGKKLKFNKDEEIKDDLVYEATGSDGKKYTAQLQKKSLIVTVFTPPKSDENKEKKAIEERGKMMRQQGVAAGVTGTKKDADKAQIKEPVKEKEDSLKKESDNNKENKNIYKKSKVD